MIGRRTQAARRSVLRGLGAVFTLLALGGGFGALAHTQTGPVALNLAWNPAISPGSSPAVLSDSHGRRIELTSIKLVNSYLQLVPCDANHADEAPWSGQWIRRVGAALWHRMPALIGPAYAHHIVAPLPTMLVLHGVEDPFVGARPIAGDLSVPDVAYCQLYYKVWARPLDDSAGPVRARWRSFVAEGRAIDADGNAIPFSLGSDKAMAGRVPLTPEVRALFTSATQAAVKLVVKRNLQTVFSQFDAEQLQEPESGSKFLRALLQSFTVESKAQGAT